MAGKKHGWSIVNKHLRKNSNIFLLSQVIYSLLILLMLVMSNLSEAQNIDESEIDDEEIIVQKSLSSEVCVDEKGKCLDSKKDRIVGGLSVEKDCWHYEYIKKCNKIPSKKDCHEIPLDKFNLKKEECLITTEIGEREFCLNMKKTFSYVYEVKDIIDKSQIIMDPDNKEAVKDLLCDAFCLDGNCSEVFKETQESNDEIASAMAQLEMLSNIKQGVAGANGLNFNIFGGDVRRCHNKTSFHSNCCDDSGWLKGTGLVKCPSDAVQLAMEGRKGRCEYVGEYCSSKVPIIDTCIIETKTYCCFPTVLAKTIRLGARDQLGKDLGAAKDPQCGGLTLHDIENLDFSRIDFQEFYNLEVKPMMKDYNSDDNEALIKRSFPTGQQTTNQSAQPNYGPDSFTDTNYDGTSYKSFEEAE